VVVAPEVPVEVVAVDMVQLAEEVVQVEHLAAMHLQDHMVQVE
jgi:hypothetical protein